MDKPFEKLIAWLLVRGWPVILPAVSWLLTRLGYDLLQHRRGTILIGGDPEVGPLPRSEPVPRKSTRPPATGGDLMGGPVADERSREAAAQTTDPRFHFRFDGEACRGNALVRGKPVRLIFGEGVVTASQAVIVWGERLTALVGVTGEARLTIAISAESGVELDGPQIGYARFRDGKLLADVGFAMRILDDGSAAARLTVEFFAGARRLYGFQIARALVGSDDQSPAAIAEPEADEIDLDIAEAPTAPAVAESKRDELVLKLALVTGGLLVSLTHRAPDGTTAYDNEAVVPGMDATKLDVLRSRLNAEIGDQFYASDIWDKADPSAPTPAQAGHLVECFERVASAGFILFQTLGAADEPKAILDYLLQQPPGARLTVTTRNVFLPFEIIYPHPFSIDWPEGRRRREGVRNGDFLGTRFALEVLRSGTGNYSSLLDRHRKAPRHVSLNLNAGITSAIPPDPARIHHDLVETLGKRGVACTPSTTCDVMKEVLLGAESAASVIYVYCHGAPPEALRGGVEELHLDSNCTIRPGNMYPDTRYETAPIVILNACYGSAPSPLQFTGFLESFQKQLALGLVAASFTVPIPFGAAFGSELVMQCLFGTGTLGDRLRTLRLQHAQRGNPVPLFYSAQCQLS